MQNPFVTGSGESSNPYEWSAFLRVGLPWRIWLPGKIQSRVKNAIAKANSSAGWFIGSRRVTEADVNSAVAALRDPNDRIIQELITHRFLPVDETSYRAEREAIAELEPELPAMEPQFRLIERVLVEQLPHVPRRSVAAADAALGPLVRRARKLVTTLTYAREALK